MWVIFKYKKNEFKTFKNNLTKIIDNNIIFFNPKIKYNRIIQNRTKVFEKSIIENYVICFHKKFGDKTIIESLKYIRGLDYSLPGFLENQDNIIKFVNHCKNFQDHNGFVNQKFFNEANYKKAKFISGPLTGFIFEVITKQNNKLKLLLGNFKVSLEKNSNFLYYKI